MLRNTPAPWFLYCLRLHEYLKRNARLRMDGKMPTPTQSRSSTVNKCSRRKITQKHHRFLVVLYRKAVKGVRNSPGSFQSVLRCGRWSLLWTGLVSCAVTQGICQQCHLLEKVMQKGCCWSLCEILTLGTLALCSCVVKLFLGHEEQVPIAT